MKKHLVALAAMLFAGISMAFGAQGAPPLIVSAMNDAFVTQPAPSLTATGLSGATVGQIDAQHPATIGAGIGFRLCPGSLLSFVDDVKYAMIGTPAPTAVLQARLGHFDTDDPAPGTHT
jgi:hypothetical protein